MDKFILFADGKLATRYDRAIHGDAIPADAVAVTEEQFFQTINETDGIWTITPGGEIVKEPHPAPSLADILDARLLSITESCEAEIAFISAGYPASEVLSWPKQEAEARAWTADNQAVTPLLDSLAAARGISKAELAGHIIAKAYLFAQLSGAIIGKRQVLEDQLDAISDGLTAEELEAPITPAVQALLDDIKWDAEL